MFRRRHGNQAIVQDRPTTVEAEPPVVVGGPAPGGGADPDEEISAARAGLVDERLVRAAQHGDLDAFNTIVVRHERAVFNVCLRLLRDVASAEDATQDAFVKAWSSIDSFRGGSVRAWLLRIATNRSYDLLRTRGRRPTTSLDAQPFEIEPVWSTQAEAEEPPERFALRRELAIHLERALAALPEDQRLVVILADVQGCDYETVATITGAALGTVKSRLSRARARLRQSLRDDPTGGELFDRFGRLSDDPTTEQGPQGRRPEAPTAPDEST